MKGFLEKNFIQIARNRFDMQKSYMFTCKTSPRTLIINCGMALLVTAHLRCKPIVQHNSCIFGNNGQSPFIWVQLRKTDASNIFKLLLRERARSMPSNVKAFEAGDWSIIKIGVVLHNSCMSGN